MAGASKAASKTASKATAKPAATSVAPKRAKSAGKAPASVAVAPAFLRFYLEPELQSRVDAVLTALEQSASAQKESAALADLVADLTDAGLAYFYLRALKAAQVGFVVEQSTRLVLSGAARLISSVCRKYIVCMNDEQLVAIVRHMRELGR